MGESGVRKSEAEFIDNYSKHDIAEEYLTERLEWYGYDYNEYGIDNRHDGVQYSSRPDLAVLHDGETVGFVDAKAKSVEYSDWYGKYNQRAFEDYLYGGEITDDDPHPFPGANNVDVPVWVFMAVVDEECQCIRRECCIPVLSEDQVDRTFEAWDGNEVIVVKESEYCEWGEMMNSFNGDV